MAGFWGLDADSWANVVALATGVGVVVGGMYTVRATAKQNRDARAAERKADREAELRAQSRSALAGVIEAANEYGDVAWAPPEGGDDQPVADAIEKRERDLIRLVGRITAKLALVGEEARGPLLLAMRAYSLMAWDRLHRPDRAALTTAVRERIIRIVGDFAAAHLREDAEVVDELGRELATIHNDQAKAILQANRGTGGQ